MPLPVRTNLRRQLVRTSAQPASGRSFHRLAHRQRSGCHERGTLKRQQALATVLPFRDPNVEDPSPGCPIEETELVARDDALVKNDWTSERCGDSTEL